MKLFDPISENGHVEFNDLIYSEKDITNKEALSIKNEIWIFYHFKSFINHYLLLKKANNEDVFLIFNNLSLYLLTFIIKQINCSFIVHNNLDFAKKNRFHLFFYKRICKKVNLIYLEKRLKSRAVNLCFHKNAIVKQHPIIPVKSKSTIFSNTVFVSGRNLTANQLMKVCELEENRKVICNRVIDNISITNLEMKFVKHFDVMLASCRKVYIIGDYNYRASGILYKALSIPNIEIVVSSQNYRKEISNLILTLNLECKVTFVNSLNYD